MKSYANFRCSVNGMEEYEIGFLIIQVCGWFSTNCNIYKQANKDTNFRSVDSFQVKFTYVIVRLQVKIKLVNTRMLKVTSAIHLVVNSKCTRESNIKVNKGDDNRFVAICLYSGQ